MPLRRIFIRFVRVSLSSVCTYVNYDGFLSKNDKVVAVKFCSVILIKNEKAIKRRGKTNNMRRNFAIGVPWRKLVAEKSL